MSERGKGFPRLSLQSAVKVIDTASKFGKSWPREQFAGFGSQSGAGSVKSGAFAVRISSLRDYGLITTTKDSVDLTELGTRVSKPVTDTERKEAIRQAFLNVSPFKDLCDGLEAGVELSLDQVAQYAVFNLGISRDSREKFINIFIDSGKFVNVVTHNKETQSIKLGELNPIAAEKSSTSVGSQTAGHHDADEDASSGLLSPTIISSMPRPLNALSTEQGVNHTGDGWTLTVLLKSSVRLDQATRKKVRDLLETADDLSDLLRSLEEDTS